MQNDATLGVMWEAIVELEIGDLHDAATKTLCSALDPLVDYVDIAATIDDDAAHDAFLLEVRDATRVAVRKLLEESGLRPESPDSTIDQLAARYRFFMIDDLTVSIQRSEKRVAELATQVEVLEQERTQIGQRFQKWMNDLAPDAAQIGAERYVDLLDQRRRSSGKAKVGWVLATAVMFSLLAFVAVDSVSEIEWIDVVDHTERQEGLAGGLPILGLLVILASFTSWCARQFAIARRAQRQHMDLIDRFRLASKLDLGSAAKDSEEPILWNLVAEAIKNPLSDPPPLAGLDANRWLDRFSSGSDDSTR